MGKKLYVGNLAYSMTDGELQSLFEEYGTVESAQVIMDRETGRSKGFGFVEMSDDDAANRAIEELNGSEVKGRTIRVNESIERKDRGGDRRGGYGGDGGNRGYGGDRRSNY